jgi:phosphate acetyltransferase
MSDGLYVTGTEPATGKSAIALGLYELLGRRVGRLGVFRPVVHEPGGSDRLVDLLLPRSGEPQPAEACVGVTYADVVADEDRALSEIVARYRALAARCDRVLVVGTDFDEASASRELALNARIAVNLGLPVVCVVSGHDRGADDVAAAVDVGATAMRDAGCEVVAVIANRVPEPELAGLRDRTRDRAVPVYALPETPLLTAPTMAEVAEACGGRVLTGDDASLARETAGVLVAAMTVPNLLGRLVDDVVVITPGDRVDVMLGVLAAHLSGALPAPAGLVLTGGIDPGATVLDLVRQLPTAVPVVLTERDTYLTTRLAGSVPGRIGPDAPRKIDTALALFEEHVDGSALLDRPSCRSRGSPRR